MNSKLTWILIGLTAFVLITIVMILGAVMLFMPYGKTLFTLSPPTPQDVPGSGLESAAEIRGTVWHDLCASGENGIPALNVLPEGCLSTTGGGFLADGIFTADEPGIAEVLVRLGEGACPSVGLREVKTSTDGSFRFPDLAAGTYCLSIDPSLGDNQRILLPGSWSAPVGEVQALQTVTVAEGETNDATRFGWDYQFLPEPPTPTATATTTPTPTQTPTPTATSTPTTPCDWVKFVSDVTVPDGTTFKPDQDFRKTWRLKNIGSCTWTTDYDLVYVSGDRMTGDKVTPLKASVKPGQTIDISIELTAPIETGKHTGYWALRNDSGVVFGMGSNAKDAFWVIVKVEKPKKIVYDLAEHYCDAEWISGAGTIECPTESYDVSGSITLLDPPTMEEGRIENEAGLWVIPEGISDGYLTGTFPAVKIQSGDRFRTVVSCLDGYTACEVEFRLGYQIDDGDIKSLGKWHEAYEGGYTEVNIDLTPLAGKEVKFILTIKAGEVFDQDSGLWLHPSIWGDGDVRQGVQEN